MDTNKIRVIKAKIEALRNIDAVVTSTNVNLVAKSGADIAIHKKAGSELDNRCKQLAPISLAEPVITDGFGLRYKNIIHIVAPDYKDGNSEVLLTECYQKSIRAAVEIGARSIAFPIIGIGHHGWKVNKGISVAIDAISSCDIDVLQQMDCIYLVTNLSDVYKAAIDQVYERGMTASNLNIGMIAEIYDIDYKSIINYFTNLAVIPKFVDTLLGDNKEEKICALLKVPEINNLFRGKIEEALYKKSLYVNVKEIQGTPIKNGVQIEIDFADVEYTDIISFVKRMMMKSSNVYKNKLFPVVLDAIQTSIDDNTKTELLLTVLNNVPDEVADKITEKIAKKTGIKFSVKNIKCASK